MILFVTQIDFWSSQLNSSKKLAFFLDGYYKEDNVWDLMHCNVILNHDRSLSDCTS